MSHIKKIKMMNSIYYKEKTYTMAHYGSSKYQI